VAAALRIQRPLDQPGIEVVAYVKGLLLDAIKARQFALRVITPEGFFYVEHNDKFIEFFTWLVLSADITIVAKMLHLALETQDVTILILKGGFDLFMRQLIAAIAALHLLFCR
jgi:hypothetical protein